MKPLLGSLAASSSLHQGLDLADYGLGPPDGGAVRQLDRHEEGALVLLRQEACRRDRREIEDQAADAGDDEHGRQGDGDQTRDDPGETVAHLVDAAHHVSHDAAPLPAVLQEDAAESR
jgi:hypothetical protein